MVAYALHVIIRSIDEIAGTERDVKGEGWRSRRLLRRDDAMNVSLHWTEVEAGTELDLEYANHFEGNLCVEGEGEVVDLATNETHPIRPGVMYALDKHDHHILRAATTLKLACVFWPALSGSEKHNDSGGYDALPGR
jgi:L-ectoine synthase